mmetsp:Transcript_23736/g.56214  ORF Transcript_23736/g.56214 Transcript_23736/m.56214 type:complete len:297 (+) Transcript_23736:389-1279(+)
MPVGPRTPRRRRTRRHRRRPEPQQRVVPDPAVRQGGLERVESGDALPRRPAVLRERRGPFGRRVGPDRRAVLSALRGVLPVQRGRGWTRRGVDDAGSDDVGDDDDEAQPGGPERRQPQPHDLRRALHGAPPHPPPHSDRRGQDVREPLLRDRVPRDAREPLPPPPLRVRVAVALGRGEDHVEQHNRQRPVPAPGQDREAARDDQGGAQDGELLRDEGPHERDRVPGRVGGASQHTCGDRAGEEGGAHGHGAAVPLQIRPRQGPGGLLQPHSRQQEEPGALRPLPAPRPFSVVDRRG